MSTLLAGINSGAPYGAKGLSHSLSEEGVVVVLLNCQTADLVGREPWGSGS